MAVATISLGFAPCRLARASLERYYSTRNKGLPFRHVVLDQHYPVNKEENRRELRALCAEFGIEVFDAGRNLGLHEGFNWIAQRLDLEDDDVVIAYDLDSCPTSPGWDMALARAIQGDPLGKIVWASLWNLRSRADVMARGFQTRMVDGYIEAVIPKAPVTNSVCAWRYGWLRQVGFLTEPRAFYGHLEAAMWDRLRDKQWAFLPQWGESDDLRDLHDREYVVYKWCHSHLNSWPGDFESFLEAGCPNPEDAPAPRQLP